MNSLTAKVNPRLLSKADRLFTGTLAGRIIEILQNARRAGATGCGTGTLLVIRQLGSSPFSAGSRNRKVCISPSSNSSRPAHAPPTASAQTP